MRARSVACLLAALACVATSRDAASPVSAQDDAAARRPRVLAPGVLKVIPNRPDENETFTGPMALRELTTRAPDWKPATLPDTQTLKSLASRVVLRRDIWALEFAFKPLRMIDVDLPQPTGKLQRKKIWYLVYRVANRGDQLAPAPSSDEYGQTLYKPEPTEKDVRFLPLFVLEAPDVNKSYVDLLLPIVVPKIQEREDPAIKLYNSVEIGRMPIPVSKDGVDRSVWGVATWMDVDPEIDFFSVYVSGLSNAFRFVEKPDGTKVFSHKTLQLNFWRPGDEFLEHEDEVRFGVPFFRDSLKQAETLRLYGVETPIEHRWVFR